MPKRRRRPNPEARRFAALGFRAGLAARRNPGSEVEAIHRAFHGTKPRVVEMELPPAPKELTVIGTLEELTYHPEWPSKRGDALWSHEFGDYGSGPRGKARPLLAADPEGNLHIIPNSDARLDRHRGIVG